MPAFRILIALLAIAAIGSTGLVSPARAQEAGAAAARIATSDTVTEAATEASQPAAQAATESTAEVAKPAEPAAQAPAAAETAPVTDTASTPPPAAPATPATKAPTAAAAAVEPTKPADPAATETATDTASTPPPAAPATPSTQTPATAAAVVEPAKPAAPAATEAAPATNTASTPPPAEPATPSTQAPATAAAVVEPGKPAEPAATETAPATDTASTPPPAAPATPSTQAPATAAAVVEPAKPVEPAATETAPATDTASTPPPAAPATPSTQAPATAAAVVEPAKPATQPEEKPSELVVASWGGAYTNAQKIALFDPYSADTGIAVAVAPNESGKALTGNGASPTWDVADVPLDIATAACSAGRLAEIDASKLASSSSGSPAETDFLPGALSKCAVANVAWSSVIVVDRQGFKSGQPSSIADLFDTRKFPGKRALPKGPRYVFEVALLADGIAASEVYASLQTSAGVDRALAKLATIADDIIWWEQPHEPMALLAEGKVVMAMAFNGRAFSDIAGEVRPFDVIWDGQIYDLGAWVIPAGSSHKQAAMAFIAAATRPDRLAEQARWFPYGPMRRSALELVGKHPTLGIEMLPNLPTAAANFGNALQIDHDWWRRNQEVLAARLQAWVKARAAAEDSASEDGAADAAAATDATGATGEAGSAAATSGSSAN